MIHRIWPLAIAAALFAGCNDAETEPGDIDIEGQAPDTEQTYKPDDKADANTPGDGQRPAGYPAPVENPPPAPTGPEANREIGSTLPTTPGQTPDMPAETPDMPAETPDMPAAPDMPDTTTETPAKEPQASVTLSEEQIASINELPEAEAAKALAQKVCPVSGEPLGDMGKPIKVTAEGENVFLCCTGCKADFEAEPAKYLAKVESKKE